MLDNRHTLTRQFMNIIHNIEKEFNLKPIRDLPKCVKVNPCKQVVQKNKLRFGVKDTEEDIIIICKESSSELINGILLREAFIPFIPNSIYEIPQSIDLAMYYAYTKLPDAQKNKWLEIWKNISPKMNIKPNVNYNPTVGFPLFDKLAKGAFLKEILEVFLKFDEHDIKLTFEEYAELLEEFMTRYTPKLSKNEIFVLQWVTTKPEIQLSEIAEMLRVSVPTVSNVITKLENRAILYRFDTITTSSLGLNQFFIWSYFISDSKRKEFIEDLKNCPFTYQIYDIVDAEAPVLAHLIAPMTNTFISSLENYIKRWSDKRHIREIVYFMTDKYGRYYNFTDYSIDKKKWDVSFYKWFVWARRILQKDKDRILTQPLEKIRVRIPIVLDDLDMELLSYISKTKDTRVDSLRKAFRKGTNIIQKRLSTYKKYGILRPYAMIQNIGLNDVILFMAYVSEEESELFKTLFDFLPYNITYHTTGEHSACISIIKLPNGSSSEFLTYLRRLFDNTTKIRAYVVNTTVGSYWRFPKEFWDVERQTWKVPHNIFRIKNPKT